MGEWSMVLREGRSTLGRVGGSAMSSVPYQTLDIVGSPSSMVLELVVMGWNRIFGRHNCYCFAHDVAMSVRANYLTSIVALLCPIGEVQQLL